MDNTYEQKYKEALARAREIHCNEGEKRRDMEFIFPELKESEDERVREALIELVKMVDKAPIGQIFGYEGIKYSDMIVWLEKQGEQNPIEWNEYDKKMIGTLIKIFEINYCNNGYKFGGTTIRAHSIISWLKSLKERMKGE